MRFYDYDITLPDRLTVQEIRCMYQLLAAEIKKDDATAYMRGRDELAYKVIDFCGFTNSDPVLELSIGHDVLTYIIQGPVKSRIPTMDELQQMIGAMLFAEGDFAEKVKAMQEIVESMKAALKEKESLVAEADTNGDPTPPLT